MTVKKARTIVTPFYEALNRPPEKDVVKLLEQATSSDRMSCGGNDTCVPREKFIGGFKSLSAALPDLKWEINEVLIARDRIIVRGEGPQTPSGAFLVTPPSRKRLKRIAIDVHTTEHRK